MAKVTGEWRRLHDEELNALYSSPNIIRVIKSRMRRAGHVACTGKDTHTGFWWGDPREKDHLKDQGVDGMIILKWIFKKCDREVWDALIWLGIRTGGGLLCTR
jgi:hypothetical protein